jgi:hypothetical protein
MSPANRITAELLIEIPRKWPHSRVWRSNAGGGVGMAQVRQAIAAIRGRNWEAALEALRRPMKFGVEGMGDISGIMRTPWCSICRKVKGGGPFSVDKRDKLRALAAAPGTESEGLVAQRMLDKSRQEEICAHDPVVFGCLLSVEVKAGDDRQRPAQKAFEKMITSLGGCYVECGSCEEGIRGIEKWLDGLK